MQQIKISEVSEKAVKYGKMVTVKGEKGNYNFFDKKKGGDFTKAYAYYKQFGLEVGTVVNAEVKEETYQDTKTGEDRVSRRILYFETVENLPTIQQDETPVEITETLHEDGGISQPPEITEEEVAKIQEGLSPEPSVEELNELLGE